VEQVRAETFRSSHQAIVDSCRSRALEAMAEKVL
jgi:hypothetical protein